MTFEVGDLIKLDEDGKRFLWGTGEEKYSEITHASGRLLFIRKELNVRGSLFEVVEDTGHGKILDWDTTLKYRFVKEHISRKVYDRENSLKEILK